MICWSLSTGKRAYRGVELWKYRGIFLDFLIPGTWNLWITNTDFKFIKFYTDYQQFTLKIPKFRRSCTPPFSWRTFCYTFLQSLLTCGQSFMISTKLNKLRTLYKWIKGQYLTKYLCSKPHNRIIKSKPHKIWYKFLTFLACCCAWGVDFFNNLM